MSNENSIYNGPPFRLPAGVPLGADNGLSIDPADGDVVLGDDFGNHLADLISSRFLTMNFRNITFEQTPGGNLTVFQGNRIFLSDPLSTITTGIVAAAIAFLGNKTNPLTIPRIQFFTEVPAEGLALENIGQNKNFSVVDAGNNVFDLVKSLTAAAPLDFPNTIAGTSSDLTIALPGAAIGDVVMLGVDNASVLANGVFSAWVSAASVVTVRFTNTNLVTALDPAPGNFRVTVLKY